MENEILTNHKTTLSILKMVFGERMYAKASDGHRFHGHSQLEQKYSWLGGQSV